MKNRTIKPIVLLLGCLVLLPIVNPAPDDLTKYQTRNINFGVSGGNAHDCSGGTLGSLLTDTSHTLYILSNNHVLARFDQASPGENISQPGLEDNYCQPATIVAHYTTAPKLSSNVDAAIAQLTPGQMSPIGYIEGIGTISSVVEAPVLGLAVEKSGRTTRTTTGTIVAINVSLNVGYLYTNQIVITSSSIGSFALQGDSGSLIVTNASCHQPVGLLFAGTFDGSYVIANPVGEVLSKVGAALGRSLSFVSLVPCHPSGGQGLQLHNRPSIMQARYWKKTKMS
jgi:Peptidase family S64